MSVISPSALAPKQQKSATDLLWSLVGAVRRLVVHPISVFVLLQAITITMIVIWVVWYVNRINVNIDVSTFNTDMEILTLVMGCVLLGIILLGTIFLFVYATRQSLANRQQKTFVSSVTHELRSPLASVQLSLETLQRRQLGKDVTDKMHGMIQTDVNRLVRLVDQVLVSARLDRGISFFHDPELFLAKEAIEEAIDNARHLDREISNRIKISCDEELQIFAVRAALILVMGNLIENAVKYSPKKSPIRIDARVDDRVFTFCVEDQGMGLDKREHKRIFKLFHRGGGAAKKAIPGTGLGLYIVRSIVKGLRGKVWVESAGRNLGSTFFVTFPFDSGKAN